MRSSQRWGDRDEPTIKEAIAHADEVSARSDLEIGKGIVYVYMSWPEVGRRIVLIAQDDLHPNDRAGVIYAAVNGTEAPERFWFT